MKIEEIVQEPKFQVILNKDEAEWLMNLVQNPVVPFYEESACDSRMRKVFWDELNRQRSLKKF